jgi:hypothetical protein
MEQGDAAALEATQGPPQQPQRLLRRPVHGHVHPRLAKVSPAAAVAEAAVKLTIHGGAGAGRQRRAQDLHHARQSASVCVSPSVSRCLMRGSKYAMSTVGRKQTGSSEHIPFVRLSSREFLIRHHYALFVTENFDFGIRRRFCS